MMQTHQFMFLVLLALGAVSTTVASGSEFVAAVYEHAFLMVENRTVVRSKKEAVAIVMQNMDVYEVQMKKAKEQVGAYFRLVTNCKHCYENVVQMVKL